MQQVVCVTDAQWYKYQIALNPMGMFASWKCDSAAQGGRFGHASGDRKCVMVMVLMDKTPSRVQDFFHSRFKSSH